MKQLFWVFVCLVCLISRFSYATIDDGSVAKLVAFIGAHDEYVLVAIENIHSTYEDHSYQTKLQLFKMGDYSNEVIAEVIYPEPSQSEVVTEKKFVDFFIQQMPTVQNVFLQKLPIKTLEKIKKLKPYSKSWSFKTPRGELRVELNHPQEFHAMVVWDSLHDLACYDEQASQNPFNCNVCSWMEIRVGKENKQVQTCSKEVGQTIRSLTNAKKEVFPVGTECHCQAPGYVLAVGLKVGDIKLVVLGPSFLLTPQELPYGKLEGLPHFSEADAYINQKGNMIVVGSLVHTPALNGQYFPFVAIYP